MRPQAAAGRDVLAAMIKAHEIPGGLALENSFNRVDWIMCCWWGGFDRRGDSDARRTREQVIKRRVQRLDRGGALRTYRHAPKPARVRAGGRRCTSRAVRHALIALTVKWVIHPRCRPKLGAFRTCCSKAALTPTAFGSYVMENVLFKISFQGIPRTNRGGMRHAAASKVAPRLDEVSAS